MQSKLLPLPVLATVVALLARGVSDAEPLDALKLLSTDAEMLMKVKSKALGCGWCVRTA